MPQVSVATRILKDNKTPYSFLVIDDSKFIIRNMEIVVDLLGGVVAGTAYDGIQGVEQYEKLKPDVVTCDVMMPHMTGIEVIKNLVKIDPHVKIIMISSLGHQEIVREAMNAGAKYYILKPFQFLETAITIKRLIQNIFCDHKQQN